MSRSAKLLLFGAILTLFSLMLVLAGFVSLQVQLAETTIPNYSSGPESIGLMVLAAIFVGVVGLVVALGGIIQND
jgi:hypothetical protein